GERSVVEPGQEQRGVVDADRLDLAGDAVHALLDESFGNRADLVDAAVQPHRGVDAMGEKVAGDAAARDANVEAPEPRPSLRQFLGDRPILQEFGSVMVNSAELALVN